MLPSTGGTAADERLALVAPVAGAALLSAGLMGWASGSWLFAAAFAAGALVLAALAWVWARTRRREVETALPDWSLGHALAEQSLSSVAVTDRAGRLVCGNNAYRSLWGADRPPVDAWTRAGRDAEPLVALARDAWRDGAAAADALTGPDGALDVSVRRAGEGDDLLVWRLSPVQERDLPRELSNALAGELGDRLGRAGAMAVLVDGDERIEAATRAWALRATGDLVTPVTGRTVGDLLTHGPNGVIRFVAEGTGGAPLRLLHVPLEDIGRTMFLAFDEASMSGSPLPGGGELEAVTRLLDPGAAPPGAGRPRRAPPGRQHRVVGFRGADPPPATPATWWWPTTRARWPTTSAACRAGAACRATSPCASPRRRTSR